MIRINDNDLLKFGVILLIMLIYFLMICFKALHIYGKLLRIVSDLIF